MFRSYRRVNAAPTVTVQADYDMKRERLHRTCRESAVAMHECITEIWRDIHELGKSWRTMQTGAYTRKHRVTTIPKPLIDTMMNAGTAPTLDDAIELRRAIINDDRPRSRRVHRPHMTGESFPEMTVDDDNIDAFFALADEPEPDADERDVIASNIARFGTTYHPDDVAFTTPNNVVQFRNITASMAETYERKNADYGNSFGESIAEFGAVAGVVRIGDKFNRLKNLIKNPGTQRVNDESIADTLLDMANYCIMLKIELENSLTNPQNN